ncbi:CHAP domain-containing protein [Streptococcus sciuri]|uniref:N-acetylmuramoyl-L-alanine amidase n=1 Tax=Streptococcus sciuri TaxID=2973939 RepID=A0ABT2F825_9STRE|nr:CHAP domain-containing protein [Streptococcus sciuri]MCS4487992.1 CHAP domain-containing protein [Streptococcus sciuri]
MRISETKHLLATLFISITLSAAPGQATVIGDDYPSQWRHGVGADSWGMYLRQCTSFVAFRLNSTNGFSLPQGYGNAISWGSIARSQGYRVDMSPTVGSIAWFSSGVNGAGSYGHVAWVAEVDGDTVTTEEYNYDYGQGSEQYYRRSFHKNQVSGYIHFKDLSTVDTSNLSPSSPISTSVSLTSRGCYIFPQRSYIKNIPQQNSKTVAYYDSGDSVNYDSIIYSEDHQWLSYISYSGIRRYIAIE